MDLIPLIDILGTISFAISGALTAMKKRMDIFGILIIALVTAVGGGTLRDLLIGKTPVTWMLNTDILFIVTASALIAVLFRRQLRYLRRSLFLFDTIGIGLYTTVGVELGLTAGLHPMVCVVLGTLSACFGGVIRDMLCNEIPVIFHKEIYATACIAGGVFYLSMDAIKAPEGVATIGAFSIVIVIRILAVTMNLQLPFIYKFNSMTDD